MIDAESPDGENPNHFPANTLVLVPGSWLTIDPVSGTITANLNFIGSVLGVVTNPAGYVQTLIPDAPLLSSFDPATAQMFGTKPQFTFLQWLSPKSAPACW